METSDITNVNIEIGNKLASKPTSVSFQNANGATVGVSGLSGDDRLKVCCEISD